MPHAGSAVVSSTPHSNYVDANPQAKTSSDTRGATRFVPLRAKTSLTIIGGKKMDARIINVSATGIAVEADFTAVGPESIEAIGLRKVLPGRRIRRGAVFLFVKPIDPKLCKPEIVI